MAKKEIDGVEVNGKSTITSLKIIKQVCEDSADCDGCPFFTDPTCGIINFTPNNWKILEFEKFQSLG